MQEKSHGAFCGRNLQIARQFRALTQSKLAEKVSSSCALISQCETGKKKQPRRDLVEAFGTVLGFEPEFLYRRFPDLFTEDDCNFRHRQTTPERIKAQVRAHATLIGVVISVLRSINLIPPINLPKTTVSTPEEIEMAAEHCRKHWELGVDGPIGEIREVLENAGVVVINHLVKSKKVDTFSRYSASMAVIFPDQEIQSSSRWNFEIAHELGHLVMHRGVRTGSRETEEAADAFASAFMMPREAFAREFCELPFSWPHIFELKKRWHTSAAAVLSRAYDLRLIEAVEYRKALKHMSIKGWTKKDPHDGHVKHCGVFEKALNGLGQKANLTVDLPIQKLCAKLLFTPDTFREVTGIAIPSEKDKDRSSGSEAASALPATGPDGIVTVPAPVPEPGSEAKSEPYGFDAVKPGVKKLFLLRGIDNCDRAQHCEQGGRAVGVEIWRPEYIDRPAFKGAERVWVIINRGDDPEANRRFLKSISADDQIRERSLVATVSNQSDLISLFKWVLQQERAHTFYETTFERVFEFKPIPLFSHTAKLAELIEPPAPEKAIDHSSFYDSSDWWRR